MSNWRTTLAGAIVILGVFIKTPDVATILRDPDHLAIVAAGIGLILSRDAGDRNV